MLDIKGFGRESGIFETDMEAVQKMLIDELAKAPTFSQRMVFR